MPFYRTPEGVGKEQYAGVTHRGRVVKSASHYPGFVTSRWVVNSGRPLFTSDFPHPISASGSTPEVLHLAPHGGAVNNKITRVWSACDCVMYVVVRTYVRHAQEVGNVVQCRVVAKDL